MTTSLFIPDKCFDKTMIYQELKNYKVKTIHVATTHAKTIAEDFATDYGARDGHLYTIDTDNLSGIDVNDALGNHIYQHEQEIVFPGGISTESIKGATPILKDGSYGDYSILNPNYKK